MWYYISSSFVQLIIVLICVMSHVTCYDHVSKYHYGRPDPIGIDFAATHAIAVYANSESNFTVIGSASGVFHSGEREAGRDYAEYVEAMHFQSENWESPSQIVDDSPQFGSDTWDEHAAARLSSWYLQVKRKCCRALPSLSKPSFYCSGRGHGSHTPRSRYRHLVAQHERAMQLKQLLPKYFHPSMAIQPLTKSKFVFLVYQMLIDLKSQAQKEHNITITSAVIVVPTWVPWDLRDLYDEAAFLAGIGTFNTPFDRPYSRVEMAVRTASPASRQWNKTVMVLDLGQYHLSAHHFVMNQWNSSTERFSSRAATLGERWIWSGLGTRLIDDLNSNVTEEERIHLGGVSGMELLKVIAARKEIKDDQLWPEDMEFANRTKTVLITEFSGRTRPFNMTGADVQDIEEQYITQVADVIRHLLLRHDLMTKYLQTLPDWEAISEISSWRRWKVSLSIAASVPPPPETGSWFHNVSEFIVLNDGWEVELLHQAFRRAFALEETVPEKGDGKGICVPAVELAARGAALHAMHLVKMYENRQREMLEMQTLRDAHRSQRLDKQGCGDKECRKLSSPDSVYEKPKDQKEEI